MKNKDLFLKTNIIILNITKKIETDIFFNKKNNYIIFFVNKYKSSYSKIIKKLNLASFLIKKIYTNLKFNLNKSAYKYLLGLKIVYKKIIFELDNFKI